MLTYEMKVYTEQRYDSHKDREEKIFQGIIRKKNGNTFIIYKEKDLDTGCKTTNQLKLGKDGSISIRRMGDVQSFICFNEGKPYTCFYHTGQGSIELVFKPTFVNHKKIQLGYEIELRYAIYMKDLKLSDNIYILRASILA